MSPSRAPAGFVTIGPGIYISLSPVRALPLQPNGSAPTVILIFGWMGALTRHLQVYSLKYDGLYPCATQIIVKCDPFFLLTSERGQQNRLLPVAEALEALGCLPSANNSTQEAATLVRPRVLVHSFSNGGGLQLTLLGRLLSSRYTSVTLSEYLVSAVVLDSSAGFGDFRSISAAFSIAIRNPVVRYIMLVLVYVIHVFRLSLQTAFGIETMGTRYLKALLNPRVLPWMNAQTPRLYIFSKKDELVPWRAVQQHADAARTLGLSVRCEVYEESAHVAHMRHDPKRYWASIQDLWEAACCDRPTYAMEAIKDTVTDTGLEC